MMPVILLAVGIFVIILFFTGLSYFSDKWVDGISWKRFERRLISYSMLFRLIAVLYLYFLSYLFDPLSFPMELAAADSINYHEKAKYIASEDFEYTFKLLANLYKSRSDWGYTFYQSVIYRIFGPYTLPVRILNVILGSISAVLIARIANLLFGNKAGRLSGIIYMLFPSMIWFTAIQLKETLMIFIVVALFYHAIKMYEIHKFSVKGIFIIILLLIILFFFRTFLAALVIMSVLFYYFLGSIRRLTITKLILVTIVSFSSLFVINKLGLREDIIGVYAASEGVFSRQLESESNSVGNINYDISAVTPFIVMGSLITPFPSYLVIDSRQIPIIAHFQNEVVRNVMYFFAFIGLFLMIKSRLRKSAPLLFFIAGYAYVLAVSGTSFQDRFHLLLIPFIIVAMALGLMEINKKWLSYWNLYLILIFIAHLSWSIFKINIRGL